MGTDNTEDILKLIDQLINVVNLQSKEILLLRKELDSLWTQVNSKKVFTKQ